MEARTQLIVRKLVREQKRLSGALSHHVLTRSGGLCETSARVCKNLVVAVAVAKRPGFFEFYVSSERVQHTQVSGDCTQLVRKMTRLFSATSCSVCWPGFDIGLGQTSQLSLPPSLYLSPDESIDGRGRALTGVWPLFVFGGVEGHATLRPLAAFGAVFRPLGLLLVR